MEKYKYLRKIEQDILQFITRYKKEYGEKMSKSKLNQEIIKFINGLELEFNVYLDIINIICNKENDYSTKILLKEIKVKIKTNSYYKNYIINDVYSDEFNIVNFIMKKMDNFSLLTEPVIQLFGWTSTLKGISFYASLNKKVRKKLRLFNEFRL